MFEISNIIQNFWPGTLRRRLALEVAEKEMHATSVRALIAQRERLFAIMEYAGSVSIFKNGNNLAQVLESVRKTESQFYQDIFGLLLAKGRRGGYFVEFGACDGMRISNTYLLENEFDWNGIVAEPGRDWHGALRLNRRCHIDTRCVHSQSGMKIPFYEAADNNLQSGSVADHMNIQRYGAYEVETVSLLDLLTHYDAPRFIDFMSVDTEGTEYEILSNFPFDNYEFGLICVEHHLPEEEAELVGLMSKNGYKQVFRSISSFDGWYIKDSNSAIE